jgi:hypothetical protein
MEKTGESYTAARAVLLTVEEPKATEGPALHDVGRGDPAQDEARMGAAGAERMKAYWRGLVAALKEVLER